MRLIAVVTLLLLCVLAVSAGEVQLKAQKIEVSGLVGTIGLGGAAYWPLVSLTDYEVSVGPLVALGTEAVAFGGGVNIGVDLDFPVLENINFGWGGYGYSWTADAWGWEFGVGKSWEVE